MVSDYLKIFYYKKLYCAGSGDNYYVHAPNGLYPLMVGSTLSPKQNDLRIKRFEFIGRLLAQSLIDSRMVKYKINLLIQFL
jgi:hypothetical protein